MWILNLKKKYQPGGADRSRADSDLDDVGSGEDESFDHVAGHNISGLKLKMKL